MSTQAALNFNTGKNIRFLMKERKLTAQAVADQANAVRTEGAKEISSTDVENVIYGRSKKLDKIEAIAKGLEVSIESLKSGNSAQQRPEEQSTKQNEGDEVIYNGKIYRKVLQLVEDMLSKNGIDTSTKDIMDEYTDYVYRYVMSEEKPTVGKKAEAYFQGALDRDLRTGRFAT